jgi:1-acyl-sn-glycerol-3-phosphate acyltransferase
LIQCTIRTHDPKTSPHHLQHPHPQRRLSSPDPILYAPHRLARGWDPARLAKIYPDRGASHFELFLGIIFTLRANVKFMGKAELFRPPIGWFFYYCGGVPVDRKKSTGLVEQMVEACNKSDRFILTIAPEGTRHHVTEWKRGFYHIAKNAGIPIVMAIVDGRHKVVHAGRVFHPTTDIEADMKAITGMFEGVVGINPRRKYITLKR